MEFFNKVGETISNKGKDMAKKAKELAEISSLNGQISTQEEMIDHIYLEIGKTFFKENKDKEDNLYKEQCDKIKEAFATIYKLKTNIQTIKGIQVCPKCGAEVANDVIFCPSCGGKVNVDPEVVKEPEEKQSICPKCGAEIEENAVFCAKCGCKIEKEQ